MQAILKYSLISLFVLTSQLSFAGSFVDSATVTSVEKVYKNYRVDEPYQECYIQETVQNGDGSATNELFGAVLGGAIGNKLGDGDGKDAMTIFGALMGASIANDVEKANSTGKKIISQEVCETKVRQVIEKRLSHYLVTVDYAGRDVSFKSNRRPSKDVIKVEVTVDGLGN
ncbi:glycine zipper 2TM domain-containing protein [Candidatus Thioglobus sp.]|nr:glycine zipper 2TM domain-containing protein [Candidatus Thioglobus sp.]